MPHRPSVLHGLFAAATMLASGSVHAATAARPQLPAPAADPLRVDDAADPVLALDRVAGDDAAFAGLIREGVRRQPEVAEAQARETEAEANRGEARAQLLPQAEMALSRNEPVVRDFVGGADTLFEATRARPRTDATLNAEQLLFDFGAASSRVRAARQRRDAAAFGSADETNQAALRAIQATYDLVYARALSALARSFLQSQVSLRAGVEEQVRAGLAADGDLPQVDAVIASARSRQVRYERRLATAEAGFAALFGRPAPAVLPLGTGTIPAVSLDAALAQAGRMPEVQQAETIAAATQSEARAARRDRLPRLSAGVGAGRYYLFDNGDNYDVRASVRLVQRLGGGLGARADAAEARASQAGFRVDRVRRDTMREAEVAWRDVANLQNQLDASRQAYVANRQARDVLFQRYRYTRGSLFNLLSLSDGFFAAAENYALTSSELKLARYTLLTRTGRLLPLLAIDPATRAS